MMVSVSSTANGSSAIANSPPIVQPRFAAVCSRLCGIYPFHRKRVTRHWVGVNTACLDGFDASGVPVRETHSSTMK